MGRKPVIFLFSRSKGIPAGQTNDVKVHVHQVIAILTRSWRAPYLAQCLAAS